MMVEARRFGLEEGMIMDIVKGRMQDEKFFSLRDPRRGPWRLGDSGAWSLGRGLRLDGSVALWLCALLNLG